MGIRSSFFLFLFGITCCIFSQQESPISPFSSPINWQKIAHKTNVGIYIKGNDSKIQKIVQIIKPTTFKNTKTGTILE